MLPGSSLFTIHPESNARFVVETDPRFTSYRQWLSSDYLLSALAIDPATANKRLGDGFYEQKLIRDQVATLTGHRFLGDHRNDEAQYMALMNAGATFAKTQQLRPGIALSPAQVAQLTSDIVWLVTQTVTLPDGSTTTALVPQVFLAPRKGDLAQNGSLLGGKGGGALISANEVRMALTSDVNNSATIMGRRLVDISAQNLHHSGLIQSDVALLSAREDIHISGAQVRASSAAVASAGGDLHITTTTTQSGSNQVGANRFSHSGIERVAGIYVSGPAGVLLASAGGDIHLSAAQLHNAGSGLTSLNAAGDVNLKTVQVGSSQNITWSANNHLRQSSSSEVGSQVSGGGALHISAQNDITMRAAEVNARGALNVNAGGNVLIEAGANIESLAEARQSTSKGFLSRTTTTTRSSSESASAQASTLAGQGVRVTGQNVVSVGTRLASSDGVLHIEGADKTLLYATQDSHKSESSSETKSSFLGFTTGKSNSTSSSERSSAVRTELISDEAVRIGVGERTELVGARVQAPQIAFVRSQGAAGATAGELHLGAATETDQASHKRTSTTLGLWQKQQGSGHERNSAQMTELLGAVHIASDIALSVQLPRAVNASAPNHTSPAPSLQAQVQQLASTNPGLAYLEQLQTNPKVQWSELELAQREWRYEQQGLTGAGAALVALAVAWATGGMGVELLGSTSTTTAASAAGVASTTITTTTLGGVTLASSAGGLSAAGAALNVGFAGLASTASVSLINNGGDIGKTLRELGSQDSLKSLLLSMATAGALNGLSNSLTINGQTLASITPQTGSFGANLGKTAIQNVASATINSALTGASLEDSIQTALMGALVGTAAGQTANWIGDVTAESPALKALAHALAGCVAGAAGQGGGAGCSAGAAGAVADELAAQWINPSGDPSKSADTVAFASLMGGLAGALATGDGSAASVNTAATTGANAALHNYLSHSQWTELAKRLQACKSEAECAQVRKEFFEISKGQDAAMREACKNLSSAACRTHINTALAGSRTQTKLVLSGQLPDRYLGGSDLNASARLTAVNALKADIQQICANSPSCQAKNQAALNALGSTLLDFTPGIGDVKGFVEAETPFDYVLAVVGAAGPVGDGLKKVLQEGSALYKADKIGEANQLFKQALGMDATAGLPGVKPSLSGNLSKTKLGDAVVVQTDTLAQRLMISDVVASGDQLGVKTERLVNDVIKSDPTMKVLDGTKYRGEKGLDHVVQFVDPADGVTKTMVIDSKQLAINGSTRLDPRAAGGVMQLSDASLRVIVDQLKGSPAGTAIGNSLNDGTLVKAVAYVDKATGELKIVRVEVPNTPKR